MRKLNKFGVELYQDKLKNGVDVFLFKRKGMPVYIRTAIFAGSRFDTIPGTAHFFEHMIVAGSQKFPSKNLIADYIQRVGGEFNASTSNTVLRLNVEIPEAKDIEIGTDVINECLTKSLFDEKTIETERGSIVSELNAKKTNPNEYVFDLFSKLVFQGTILENSVLGTESEVKSIKKEDLTNFGSKYVHAGNIAFVVSGDIEMGVLMSALQKIDISRGNKFSTNNKIPIIRERELQIEFYPNVKQIQVLFGCRTTVETYKEYCSLRVLNNVLAGGRGSRLITKLRYENGLVYSVSGSVMESDDWGMFRIRFSCDREKFQQAKDIILSEFDDLKINNITQSELGDSKSNISKGSIRDLQTSISWVNSHDMDALFEPEALNTIEDYIETIENLTLEDIDMVIKKYLKEEDFYTAICGEFELK